MSQGWWPEQDAPGSPGIAPTWTSSAKDTVGASLGNCRVWFTLGYGIVNEVYYPRADLPQVRDLGFIVADGKGFWCELKRLGDYQFSLPRNGVPAPRVIHRHPRFTLELRLALDPLRDALLIELVFRGEAGLKPYVLLAPHLGGAGQQNITAVGRHYGRRVLWAEQGPFGLALMAAGADQQDVLGRASAGYVGASDGWQDFSRNGAMSWEHERAGPGNVAMLGELPGSCVLALAFGTSRGAAASLAAAALAQPFELVHDAHVAAWTEWQERCERAAPLSTSNALQAGQVALSRMVLRSHCDHTQPGAMVASLSVPWGNSHDDNGGYHLVWPRDAVQCASALLCAGAENAARNTLRYLLATQHEDGHWNQNQWLGGTPFWQGVQLDETALPVVLAALLAERAVLADIVVTPMIRRALGYLVRMGPVTDQDRWEEDRGLNAWTLAACIAALVSGAAFLEAEERNLALDVADDWNARLESWLYVSGGELARQHGVDGHYVRMAPPEALHDAGALAQIIPIRNRDPDPGLRADQQVSTDFIQLVRFGLRSPRDPRIVNSLRVIDAMLRVETPRGVAWHRYNGDGYGENPDGSGYDGTGIGRLWPLLGGERGHLALLAGEPVDSYLDTLCRMTGVGGMMPEQVWDADPIPELRLQIGAPSGSAMPLAWTHAEFLKLAYARQRGRAVDCPRAVSDRYAGVSPASARGVWSVRAQVREFSAGRRLRLVFDTPVEVAWRSDDGPESTAIASSPCLPGVHVLWLPTTQLRQGQSVLFRWRTPGETEYVTEARVTAGA